MKTKVKATYPLLARHIKKRLREKGWSRMKVGSQMEKIKPDYQSQSGRVKRYSSEVSIPEAPEPQEPVYCIIGNNAATLKVVKKSVKFPPQFSGTKAECMDVLKKAITQWFNLTKGREIEEIIGAKMEMLEAQPANNP